jgi:hypothetical protein
MSNFIVVQAFQASELASGVDKLLKQGWQLQGSHTTTIIDTTIKQGVIADPATATEACPEVHSVSRILWTQGMLHHNLPGKAAEDVIPPPPSVQKKKGKKKKGGTQ